MKKIWVSNDIERYPVSDWTDNKACVGGLGDYSENQEVYIDEHVYQLLLQAEEMLKIKNNVLAALSCIGCRNLLNDGLHKLVGGKLSQCTNCRIEKENNPK